MDLRTKLNLAGILVVAISIAFRLSGNYHMAFGMAGIAVGIIVSKYIVAYHNEQN